MMKAGFGLLGIAVQSRVDVLEAKPQAQSTIFRLMAKLFRHGFQLDRSKCRTTASANPEQLTGSTRGSIRRARS